MPPAKRPSNPVDIYIEKFPKNIQVILKKMRAIVCKRAPDAEESLGYGMPAYKLHGKPLVYFAGWKEHIGFYPTPSGTAAFKKELSKYESAKGSIKFPLDKPIPYTLIEQIVRFRVKENIEKMKVKKK